MDFWVVVAAAGAGCLTKRLQSISTNKDGLSKLSCEVSSSGNQELHNYPTRRSARRKKLEIDASMNGGSNLYEHSSPSNCGSTAEWASPSRLEDQASSGDLREYYASAAASLPAGFSSKQTEADNEYSIGFDSNNCGSSEVSSDVPLGGEMATFHGSNKRGRPLRSRYLRGQFLKPQSSLETCLLAQLYNHHAEMGDFSLNSRTPPATPNIRPLLVTNGSSIISRFTDPSLRRAGTEVKKPQKTVYSERVRAVLGVPPLPKVGCSNMTKQMQNGTGMGKSLSSSNRMTADKKTHSRNGTPVGTTMLCIGISLGIIFSIAANKKEVVKLKELLMQTENLVQDLQEELELRDSLTVKELSSENYESLDTHYNSVHGTAQFNENSTKCSGKDTYVEKAGKSPDSMTRIEAELEAELERLGMNVKAAILERRLSDAELDPDFDADFAEGEFRAEQDFPANDSNYQHSSSSTSTTRSINYAVSPRELSLRLHEVIQSRLEERIEELEIALQSSQRKVQLLESSSASKSQRRRNSLLKNPKPLDFHQTASEPLVMNLSGEALAAYNEACEELVKFESEDEDSPSDLYELKDRECLESGHCRAQEIDNIYLTGYESSDADDGKEKMLIKQIIERTKKGSPVILNALLSIEENEARGKADMS